MRIQNYGDGGDDRRRRPQGYHPPACTCYQCNELRLAEEAAKEEERRAAEYDRRVAEIQARRQDQSPADRPEESEGEEQPDSPDYEPHLEPDPVQEAPEEPSQSAESPITGTGEEQQDNLDHGPHLEPDPVQKAPEEPSQSAESPTTGTTEQIQNQGRTPQGHNLSQRPNSPTGNNPGRSNRRSSQIPRRPPPPPPRPSGTARGRPGRRKNSSLAALLWLMLIGVMVVVVAVVVYVVNPGLFTPDGDDGPALVAAPPPTEETPAETPLPTQTPLLSPTQTPGPTVEPTSAAEPTPESPAEATPIPAINCPGCPTRTLPPTTPRRGTSARLPTSTPRPTPTATPMLFPEMVMLNLINEARREAGLTDVKLGYNLAAQLHAQSSLENCVSSHWGRDGLKPYMRYSLAGGYQSNAENGSGIDYCYKDGEGYIAIRSINDEVREIMDGVMRSPGHRANVLDPSHKQVSIGLAWSRYNVFAYQHFEGDYVEFDQLPQIAQGELSFAGRTKNEAKFGEGDSYPISVNYDPPPKELTRGQLSRTYCYSGGRPVAYLREPLTGGWSYLSDSVSTSYQDCPDPYAVSPDAPVPSSPSQAMEFWRKAKAIGNQRRILPDVDAITASRWNLSGDHFEVRADLTSVLEDYGPGVYTVVLWGDLGRGSEVISEYSIFHKVEAPEGYAAE